MGNAPARARSALVGVLVVALVVAGVMLGLYTRRASATWQSPAGTQRSAVADAPCGGWDCAVHDHFAAAEALIKTKPGYLGIVVKDRQTGLVWKSGAVDRPIWTASAIKLAIAADLLVRARAGQLTITSTIRGYIDAMLRVSANRP